jgi:hypothetical protein
MVAHVSTDDGGRLTGRRVIEECLTSLSRYTFAGWVYIAANAVVHPETLPLRLTHFAPFPREDTFGIACFGVSFLSFTAARLLSAARET